MPLASKNNAIIVKDGKLAENCGCCGGWYCYLEDCPCSYAGKLPSSLNAEVAFNLTGNMYNATILGSLGTYSQSASFRITPAQAAAVNGSYKLDSQAGVLQSNSACRYTFNNGSTWIQAVLGQSSGSFNLETLSAGCTLPRTTSIHIEKLQFKVQATRSEESYIIDIYDGCSGLTKGITKAASMTYASRSFLAECPAEANNGPFLACSFAPPCDLYSYGFRLDGSLGGRDVPSCVAIPFDTIDHRWAFDVVYTDSSGDSVAAGRLNRAVTLRLTA
jgi:hypothetical protein